MRSENKSNSRERVHKLYIESEYKYLMCVLFVQRHYTEYFPIRSLEFESREQSSSARISKDATFAVNNWRDKRLKSNTSTNSVSLLHRIANILCDERWTFFLFAKVQSQQQAKHYRIIFHLTCNNTQYKRIGAYATKGLIPNNIMHCCTKFIEPTS